METLGSLKFVLFGSLVVAVVVVVVVFLFFVFRGDGVGGGREGRELYSHPINNLRKG